jgi:hypothetical protein
MRRHRAWVALCALTAALGCERLGCGGDDYLAELATSQGEVSRDFAASQGSFRRVQQQERFRVGDGLRTGAGATATLKLRPEGQVLVQSDTILRFQSAAPGQQAPRLDLDVGAIEVEGTGNGFGLDTVIGALRIERGTRVRLRAGAEPGSERLEVLVGSLEVDHEGKQVAAKGGDELVLDVGGITIAGAAEPPVEPAPPAPVAADAGAADAGVPPDAVAAEEAVVEDPDAPKRAELSIAAGESVTVHDPRPATRVRVVFSGCPGPAALEVARRKRFDFAQTRGNEAGIVRLPAGSYRYRVRCLAGGKPQPAVAQGSIRVVRDAGSRRLPTRAPQVTVDADGRRYTLRYQNRLPRITLRWPVPPVAPSYVLELDPSRGRAKTRKLAKPMHTFGSGEIREGVHEFRFSTPDGRAVANGSLSLSFDNAADAAYLSEPSAGTVAGGQAIAFEGAVLTGSSVRVDATDVPIDAQGRFSTSVTPDGKHDAIAVRVTHPGSGVHYYLRRLR